jgi:hypothetical protein
MGFERDLESDLQFKAGSIRKFVWFSPFGEFLLPVGLECFQEFTLRIAQLQSFNDFVISSQSNCRVTL